VTSLHAPERLGRSTLAWCLAAGLLTAAVAFSPALRADDSKPAAADTDDADFIEFLGSVDSESEDADWVNYVAESDPTKVATGRSNAPAPEDRSSSGGKKKDDE